jgi:acyl carrier protein
VGHDLSQKFNSFGGEVSGLARYSRHVAARPFGAPAARHPLVLVHVRLDQACINRECFAANQTGRNAFCDHGLEYSAQRIALAKALVPRTTEYRVIGNPVLNGVLRYESIWPYCKHIAQYQHPDRQHRIDHLDSLDQLELLILIEEEFFGTEFSDDAVEQIEVVGDLIRYMEINCLLGELYAQTFDHSRHA